MMERDAIVKIEDLVLAAAQPIEVEGMQILRGSVIKPPQPECLKLLSLTSLVDFTKDQSMEAENFFLQVYSPTKVLLLNASIDNCAQRALYAKADVTKQIENNFEYGHEYSMEDFIVAVQGAFAPTDNRNLLIESVSRVSSNKEDTIEDDGFTQEVSAKAGIHLKEKIMLPNPIKLQPYKSFPEIETPEESFIFRVSKGYKDNLQFKLFNSKSLLWELTCVQKIKEYLKEHGELPVI